MTEKNNFSLNTLCVQAGYEPKKGEPRVVPIVQATTYKYDNADDVSDLFDLKTSGFFYTRLANPTVDAFEKKIAALEGGVGALATASGQSATVNAILNIADAGDHIVAFNNLYGGTFNLLSSTLKRLGIECTFIPVNDLEGLEKAIKDNTKLVYGETIGNPAVDVLDIEGAAEIAHRHNIPLIVDNTFATPVLCRPFDFGADIVVHSSSKFLDGHGIALGGVIVDSGKFNWTKEKFPCITEPDPSYHGLSYTEAFGPAAYITRARVVLIRDFGNTLSPQNAFLTYIGIDTLALRLERHSENALKVAKYLESRDDIEFVHYPFLESSPSYELAKKYLKGGSGVIAFGIKGGVKEAKDWINNLKLASLVVHVADVRTHALHPASMTHKQLSEEELLKQGVKPNLIRLSVGIEDVDDIISDLEQAFN